MPTKSRVTFELKAVSYGDLMATFKAMEEQCFGQKLYLYSFQTVTTDDGQTVIDHVLQCYTFQNVFVSFMRWLGVFERCCVGQVAFAVIQNDPIESMCTRCKNLHVIYDECLFDKELHMTSEQFSEMGWTAWITHCKKFKYYCKDFINPVTNMKVT